LERGDCGRILYLKTKTPETKKTDWRPLGMYVGESELTQNLESKNYRAVLLHQTFREMEEDYPHHINEVRLFGSRRHSQ